MNQRPLLFDASSILTVVREARGEAVDILGGGSTISLANYEVGNTLWKECFLLKRIASGEAVKLLKSIFPLIRAMDVAVLEDEELGSSILDMAGKRSITYYDAAYLTEAQRSNKILVTEDEKLAAAAEKAGVKTVTPKTIRK